MASGSYHSPRRREAAAATRRAILDAARGLFVERGYAATTVGDIARVARVAPGTVYTSVGGKPRLLEEIVRLDSTDPRLSEFHHRVSAASDPYDAVRHTAAGTRYATETYAEVFEIIQRTAGLDPAVDQAARLLEREFRRGLRHLPLRLEELGALRGGVDEAVDTLAYFFGYPSWRRLTTEFGWPYDQAERWLAERVTEALLPTPAGRT